MDSKVQKRMKLQKRLLRWRIVLQWIGGVIMVPSVILGLSMNFGWVPTWLAEPLLVAIGIAIIPLLGSISCTIAFHNIRERSYRQSVKSVTDHIDASAAAAQREAGK